MPKPVPWIKFYPDDWNGDLALSSCSLAAQGLLVRLIAIMHRSEPYGYLLFEDTDKYTRSLAEAPTRRPRSFAEAPTARPTDIARAVGVAPNTFRACLRELLDKGVLKRDEIGIYSARMVRDQQKREEARRHGVKGGNPSLVKGRVNPPLNPTFNNGVNPTLKLEEEEDKDKEQQQQRNGTIINKERIYNNTYGTAMAAALKANSDCQTSEDEDTEGVRPTEDSPLAPVIKAWEQYTARPVGNLEASRLRALAEWVDHEIESNGLRDVFDLPGTEVIASAITDDLTKKKPPPAKPLPYLEAMVKGYLGEEIRIELEKRRRSRRNKEPV